ncbi:hypothetical protein LJR164_002873 [Phenylobacterium sp. LjRoot164]|uniref:hypothetical protein n=1 Tax=unclassified Phenylobacterium TaxID=2640670 RepID=UPI003ECE2852
MAIGATPDAATVAQITAEATTAAAKIVAQAQAGNASLAASAAVVAAIVTCAATIYGARKSARTNESIERLKQDREDRRGERERAHQVSRFSEPLARSAYDLQSRLYNLLRKGVLEAFVRRGDARERRYAIDNTVFLIAQYLCWTELVRREVQLIDLGENDRTRRLLHLQDNISGIMGTDAYSARLRIFAGEQRALGEALIDPTSAPTCIGYGAFLAAFPPQRNALIDALRKDLEVLARDIAPAVQRLGELQHALIDLLDLLDADALRFPMHSRSKV